jgi:hypothetical protein
MKYVKGRWQKWARGLSPQGGASRGWVAPLVVRLPCGPSRLLLLASSVFWENIIFWYFSRIFLIFKIWCLDGPFSSRILTPAANPPMIIKHAKTEETT